MRFAPEGGNRNPMFDDSGVNCFGKKYARISGNTVGSFFVDKVNDDEKEYLDNSFCTETPMDQKIRLPSDYRKTKRISYFNDFNIRLLARSTTEVSRLAR